MSIFKVVCEHDIPSALIINFDHLCYLTSHLEKERSSQRNWWQAPDSSHICSVAVGDFLPMQLIYTRKTKRCLSNLIFDFLLDFIVTFMKNHWSNMEKALEHFEKVVFSFFQKTREKHRYSKEQVTRFFSTSINIYL